MTQLNVCFKNKNITIFLVVVFALFLAGSASASTLNISANCVDDDLRITKNGSVIRDGNAQSSCNSFSVNTEVDCDDVIKVEIKDNIQKEVGFTSFTLSVNGISKTYTNFLYCGSWIAGNTWHYNERGELVRSHSQYPAVRYYQTEVDGSKTISQLGLCVTCSSNSQCGTDTVTGSPFCQNGNVYENWITHTCNNAGTASSSCTSSTTAGLKQTCSNGQTCSGGSCVNVACSQNSDCGISGFSGSLFCQSGNVFQNYITYTCNNPGTANSSCTNTTTPQLKQTCSNGQTCSGGSCVNVTCSTNSQCGTDGYVGSPFCQDGSVFKNYKTYTCSNPGTSGSSCSSSTNPILFQTCSNGQTCSGGTCINATTEPTVRTTASTNILITSATLNGGLIDLGGTSSANVWFQWGTTTSYGQTTGSSTMTSTGAFTKVVSGLAPNTTYHFRAVAQNSVGTSYGDDLTWHTGVQANNAPVANAGSDRTVYENQTVVLQGSGYDPDGDNVTFAWVCNGGTLNNASLIQPTFTAPAVTADTSFTCVLTVTDSNGATNSDSTNVTVRNSETQNSTPISSAGQDRTVYENQAVVLQGSGYDPDGGTVSFAWTCNGGTLSNASIAQPTLTAPSVNADTNYTCTLTVTDNTGLSSSDSLVVTVRNSATQNNAPVANAGSDRTVYENQTVVLQGSGYDPDGDNVTFAWVCNGGTLNNASLIQPTFTAPAVTADTAFTCVLIVTDLLGLSASDAVTITARNANTQAVVETNAASNIETTSATLNGSLVSLGGDDSANVWFQWGTTTNYTNRTAETTKSSTGNFATTISGLTANTTYHFRAVAQNDAGMVYGQDLIFTTDRNSVQPIADAGPNLQVLSGGYVTLHGSGYDPYGGTVSFHWACSSGTLSNNNIAQPNYHAPTVTTDTNYTCTLTVTNSDNMSASDTITITVLAQSDSNEAPQANAGSDRTVYENQTVKLLGSAYDPDGDSITYSWSCNGGSLSNAHIAQPNFTAPSVSSNTSYTCNLTVTDSEGLTDSDSVCITVNNANTQAEVETDSATNVSTSNATLNGTLVNLGGDDYASVWFQYGTSTSYGYTTSQQTLSNATSFSRYISGLTSGRTYHFRAVAQNDSGTVYGDDVTFYTNSNGNSQPVANAGPDQYVNAGNSVTLQGSGYDPDGGTVHFNWSCTGGTLSNYNIAQPVLQTYSSQYSSTYTCTLTVSADDTGYSVSDSMNVYINNNNQNISVQTNSATNVYNNSATLNGYVSGNNSGNNAYVWFQYGTSTSYGYTTSQQTMNYSSSFSQNVSNLMSNTTYHFRAVAQTYSGNTVYGNDVTFYTGSGYNNYLTVNKTVRNLTTGSYTQSTFANARPSDVLLFTITIQSPSNQQLDNVYIRDMFPQNLIYKNNLTVSGAQNYYNNSADITNGINIGSVSQGQMVTITYQAQVANTSYFNYGTTSLVNNVSVTTSNGTGSASATVAVTKSGVYGITDVSTGLTNNFLVDSFFLPLMIALAGIWMFRSGIIRFDEWVDGAKMKKQGFKASKEFEAKIAAIKEREQNI